MFADPFTSGAKTARDAQLEYWKASMRRMGLNNEEIDLFLGHNSDMIDTVPVESLTDIAKQGGGEMMQLGDQKDLLRDVLVLTFGSRWKTEMAKFAKELS